MCISMLLLQISHQGHFPTYQNCNMAFILYYDSMTNQHENPLFSDMCNFIPHICDIFIFFKPGTARVMDFFIQNIATKLIRLNDLFDLQLISPPVLFACILSQTACLIGTNTSNALLISHLFQMLLFKTAYQNLI